MQTVPSHPRHLSVGSSRLSSRNLKGVTLPRGFQVPAIVAERGNNSNTHSHFDFDDDGPTSPRSAHDFSSTTSLNQMCGGGDSCLPVMPMTPGRKYSALTMDRALLDRHKNLSSSSNWSIASGVQNGGGGGGAAAAAAAASASARESISVLVRCRPFIESDDKSSANTSFHLEDASGDGKNGTNQISVDVGGGKMKSFAYDQVFGETSTQRDVFEGIKPIVDATLHGLNGTVFAYGQTSSGKTHTMMGNLSKPEQQGMIPLTVDYLFEHIDAETQLDDKTKFVLAVSFLEIYNEIVRDLLGKDSTASLEVRQSNDLGFFVPDLSKHAVQSKQDLMDLVERANRNRVVSATNANSESSRSHSMMTIYVEKSYGIKGFGERALTAKLNMVDLAGSERLSDSQTGVNKDACKETVSINQSLTCLANVISALTSDKPNQFVPYRDSKLTRLLKDSLGGNSKTAMIACINPSASNSFFTVSTLRYASRAKMIKNKPKLNEDPKDAMMRTLTEEINRLQRQISAKEATQSQALAIVRQMTDLQSVTSEQEERVTSIMYSANELLSPPTSPPPLTKAESAPTPSSDSPDFSVTPRRKLSILLNSEDASAAVSLAAANAAGVGSGGSAGDSSKLNVSVSNSRSTSLRRSPVMNTRIPQFKMKKASFDASAIEQINHNSNNSSNTTYNKPPPLTGLGYKSDNHPAALQPLSPISVSNVDVSTSPTSVSVAVSSTGRLSPRDSTKKAANHIDALLSSAQDGLMEWATHPSLKQASMSLNTPQSPPPAVASTALNLAAAALLSPSSLGGSSFPSLLQPTTVSATATTDLVDLSCGSGGDLGDDSSLAFLSTFQAELRRLSAQAENRQRIVGAQKIAQLTQVIKKLRRENSEMKSIWEAKLTELENVNGQKHSEVEQIKAIIAVNQAEAAKAEELSRENQVLQDKLVTAEQHRLQDEQSFSEKLATAQLERQREHQEMVRKLADLQATLTTKQAEVARLTSELKRSEVAYEQELESKAQQLSTLQQTLDDMRSQYAQSAIFVAEQQSSLNSQQAVLHATQQQLAACQSELKTTQTQLAQQVTVYSALNEQMQKVRKEALLLTEQQLQATNKERSWFERERALEAQKQLLEERIEVLEKRCAALDSEKTRTGAHTPLLHTPKKASFCCLL